MMLALVVQTLDSAIHWINHYPAAKYYENQLRYPLDSDLSGGQRYLTFEQPGPDGNCLFRQLNWKDLSTQFQIQKALMVYKSLNDLVPGYLSSKLVEQYETCYSLRDSVNKPIFIVPFPQTNFMNNSFSYSRAVLWNSLPYDMREAKSLSQFKRLAHLNF